MCLGSNIKFDCCFLVVIRPQPVKHLLVKATAVMGPTVEIGDVQEAVRLNRLLRLYPPSAEGGERWELEADPRHVEILVSQMGLSNESKVVSTPGVRTIDEEDGKELDAEGGACYRSWTTQASNLSQDRCELQFGVKELARRMQQRTPRTCKPSNVWCDS